MKINKRKFSHLILLFLFIFLIVINLIQLYFHDFNIKFEMVYESDNLVNLTNEISPNYDGTTWFTLRNKSYDGFYSEEYLKEFDIDFKQFNYDKYTYIVTVGHTMKSISYSYDTMKNRKLLVLPKEFIGKIVLNDKFENKVFIYKIKRIDLDCDYHQKNRMFIL